MKTLHLETVKNDNKKSLCSTNCSSVKYFKTDSNMKAIDDAKIYATRNGYEMIIIDSTKKIKVKQNVKK